MSTGRNRKKRKAGGWIWLAAVALLVMAVAATTDRATESPAAERDADLVAVGQELFSVTCALCHGSNLEGTATGPTFIIPTYAPNHHGDEAFQRAVVAGVQPHHWNFGPMPALSGLDRDDVAAIVQFIRAEQEAAGVFTDPTH